MLDTINECTVFSIYDPSNAFIQLENQHSIICIHTPFHSCIQPCNSPASYPVQELRDKARTLLNSISFIEHYVHRKTCKSAMSIECNVHNVKISQCI